MPRKKPTNPFYAALVVAGVLFAITALAYVVMMVRGADPHLAGEAGLIGLMARRGGAILLVELAVLVVLTAAAIGTDEYWTRRAAEQTPDRGKNAAGSAPRDRDLT